MRATALAWLGAALVLTAGCGGDEGETEKPKVDKHAVEAAVNKIDQGCIKSGFDPQTAPSGISAHVGHLLEAYEADPKASLDGTDVKAHTVEEAVDNVAEILADCKPEDALRIKEALAKP